MRVDIKIPRESGNDNIVYISRKFFNNGDRVRANDKILEVEAAKNIFCIKAEIEGYIKYLCNDGDSCEVGSTVAIIDEELCLSEKDKCEISETKSGPIFSKKAEYLIEKNEIDKFVFFNLDFVREKDVVSYLNQSNPINARSQDKTVINLEKQKPVFIQTNTISTIFKRVDLSKYKNNKLSYTRLVAEIMSKTYILLQKYDIFNAFFSDDQLIYNDTVAVGLVIDYGKGGRIVRIDSLETNDYNVIENNILIALKKYVKGNIMPIDWQGITFTVSCLGNETIDFFMPLVSSNQSATLGIPQVNEKNWEIILSLSFDHRVVSGRIASLFLKDLKGALEEES